MNWLILSFNEWRRRPLRTASTAAGVAIGVAAMFSLLSFHDGYRDGMKGEIDRLGAHVLVVPKGCPYDAASIALHGANWPCFLKADYLQEISHQPGVANAAPAFMSALTTSNSEPFVYVGVNEQMLALKPSWKIEGKFPRAAGEVLIGAEVARKQKWKPGVRVELPGLPGREAIISGVLEATQGSDDTFIYTRLSDAQSWFHHQGELTHILVRLTDPNALESSVGALRGCDAGMDMNIVPLTHLFRTIQGLLNSTGLLLACVALVSLLVAAAAVSNSVLMSIAERSREIGVMRAIGASRFDVLRLIWLETLQVCLAGGLAGVALAWIGSSVIEAWLRTRLPFSPTDALIRWEWWLAAACMGGAMLLGSLAALLPAARAAGLSPLEAIREGARA